MGGCRGKWGATPGDLYGGRKIINVDIKPRYGWQYPWAYMWLEWKAFGMRSAWMQNVVELLMDAVRRQSPSRFMSVRIGLKQGFDTLYADKQTVKR